MAELHIRDLVKRWRARDRDFTLEVEALTLGPGDVLALVGPSGCGKSTFLELVGLAVRPDAAGTFQLGTADGVVDIQRLWQAGDGDALARLRARHFGFVLQAGGLLPFLDVRANVRLAGDRSRHEIEQLLGFLGIGDLADALPTALSVGQRQRVAVARAVIGRPAFLLADEPTAALDPAAAAEVMRLLITLARELASAVVIVSHDAALLDRFAIDRLELASHAAPKSWRTTIHRRPSAATVLPLALATAAEPGP
jgi:putative ABC transport system ATP-binding protein